MRCISLSQPWATLVALGQKKIESRSWQTSYRGQLAIHAAKGLAPVGGKTGLYEIRRESPFREALEAAGYLPFDDLPMGCIVATCELIDCVSITHEPKTYLLDRGSNWMQWLIPPLGKEYAFGDYTPGRYAWLLADVHKLPEPIPAKGALGLWNWDEKGKP